MTTRRTKSQVKTHIGVAVDQPGSSRSATSPRAGDRARQKARFSGRGAGRVIGWIGIGLLGGFLLGALTACGTSTQDVGDIPVEDDGLTWRTYHDGDTELRCAYFYVTKDRSTEHATGGPAFTCYPVQGGQR